jgi:polyhydroxyalkanoate synthesis regulator phasin
MTTAQKKKAEPGVIGRLAEKGEETIHRLVEEAEKNRTVADALHRAATAKGKLDSASRAALLQIGLAPAEDVKELHRKLEALEKRVAKLEGAKKPAARRASARKPAETS